MELQKYFSKFLLKQRKKKLSERDYFISSEICKIIGCKINNIHLYHEAFSLKSSLKNKEKLSYERLEFLGDSILGSVISCYLFSTYPDENEGFLTQMKSKIVNRKNLNKVGEELNLIALLQLENSTALSENLSGNLFESLIGALYLDINYDFCRKIILEKLLKKEDMSKLENKVVSYKGLILEWSQKKKLLIKYETCEEVQPNKKPAFRCIVFLDHQKIANATASSKKKAEERAAQRAFYMLNKKGNIIESSKTTPEFRRI